MKKLCIIYANCQNGIVAEYLNKSPYFNQEYSIKRFSVHILIAKGTTIPNKILQQAKLFIYQPVKDIHGDRSSKYLLNKLPLDCQQICFPSLYFKGYFPQLCKNPTIKIIKPNHLFGLIPHGDTNIISMLEQGKNEAEIIQTLEDSDFYTPDFLFSNLNETLAELSQRESQLDVKVSEFIKANYQHYRLFYTQNHPTDILGVYVVNQMLRLLDLPIIAEPLSLNNSRLGVLDNIQVPIYPSVIKHLNLSFANENTVYGYGSFCSNRMTFKRYISEYIELHNSTSESANAYYFKAIKLANNSKYQQAAIALNQAIELKPNNANYYRELGNISQKQNNLDRAEAAYIKGIELSPDWQEFYQLLGDVLVKKNDLSSAVLAYKQAVTLDPNNAEYYRLLGDALFNQNRLDEARKCYQKAIAIDPTKAYYFRCLGDVFKKENNLDIAISNYRKAIEVSPKVAYFHSRLGSTLAKQNKLDEGISACRQAIDLEPDNPDLYRNLGDIQLQKEEVDSALQTYQQAIALNPNQMKRIFAQLGEYIQENKPSILAENTVTKPELAEV